MSSDAGVLSSLSPDEISGRGILSAPLNIVLKRAACNTASKILIESAPTSRHAGRWPLAEGAPG
jgi:hypothetical protein